MGRIDWHPEVCIEKAEAAAMDAGEQYASVVWLPMARENCPVGQYPAGSGRTGGTMRAGLTFERDDANKMIHMGGGGAAKDYILRQELDRSLNHTVGRAGFIRDTFAETISELGPMVQERIDRM